MNRIPMLFWAVVGTVAWAMTACTSGTLQPEAGRPAGLDRVQHVVVIYMENHSFDNLYGQFPGADGLANAGSAATQTNRDGSPYATLPPALDTHLILICFQDEDMR
jgi:phospholipase C